MNTTLPVHRDLALEALRGMAAFVVVFWHLMLAFAPLRSGAFPDLGAAHSIGGRFWFAPLNGNAAVDFFFVLSGYVLVRPALLSGNGTRLALGALKRWPRLAGPVVIACMASWLLVHAGAYRYQEASRATGSPWLAGFAFSQSPPTRDESLWRALSQGAYRTFFFGDQSYDSSLWTMRLEFIGSFVVFGLGLMLLHLRHALPLGSVLMLAIAGLLAFDAEPHYSGFVAGVTLAAWLRDRPRAMKPLVALILVITAAWLMGYTENPRDFHFLTRHAGGPNPALVHDLAAILLIWCSEASPLVQRRLQNRTIALLGRLSFPVYLLHIPILCSAGCMVYLHLLPLVEMRLAVAGAAATTVIVTVAVALPLAAFDRWWVKRVGIIVGGLKALPPAPIVPASS
jgi:peptidoglycan/LPS O-acetylase OafA/YrhL